MQDKMSAESPQKTENKPIEPPEKAGADSADYDVRQRQNSGNENAAMHVKAET